MNSDMQYFTIRYLRKRLRISLIGDRKSILDPPKELHSQRLEYPEYRSGSHTRRP